ncbi:gas vesicle protein GvpG [Portibacter marinus]|uniref:gas vesicle protein GvpG n=1 Tax=Portibacter marinus TaxID=2898660 RepID=UPI001F3E3719|nr:gas vesicle protein GvpG [Portibacter marinus]
MLFKLLSAPVTGLVKIVKVVAEEAERIHYDPKTILNEYEILKKRYQKGEIDKEEFHQRKELLTARITKNQNDR